MKIKIIRTFATAALLAGLAACSNELIEPHQCRVPENAIHFTASIGSPFANATRTTPLGTESEQAGFNEGDEVFFAAGTSLSGAPSQFAVYRLTNGEWIPKDGKFLVWEADQLYLGARYPANFSEESFDNKDQRTKEKIAAADLTFATSPAPISKSSDPIHLTLQRITWRIQVRIADFKSEIPTGSKVADVKFITTDNKNRLQEWLPYTENDGGKGSQYTALLTAFKKMKISLTVNGKAMEAWLDIDTPAGRGEAGKIYTFNLTVGKDKLEVGEVNVSDWGSTKDIPEGNMVISSKWDGKSRTPVSSVDGKIYNIEFPSQWVWLSDQISTKAISSSGMVINLTDNLDFGGFELPPLGCEKYKGDGTIPQTIGFRGKVNGNNHEVKGVRITEGLYRHTGFIGALVPGAEVNNLTIECEIKGNVANEGHGSATVGGVTGALIGGVLTNCTVRGHIASGKTAVYMGGLIGSLDGGVVQNCENHAHIESLDNSHKIVGGLIGSVGDFIQDTYDIRSYVIGCGNYGRISMRGSGKFAGIVGEASFNSEKKEVRSTFVACCNVGSLEVASGSSFTGLSMGLLSVSAAYNTSVYGCFNYGHLPVGGFLGLCGEKPSGVGVFGLAESTDDNPESVGISNIGTNCGKRTTTDLNSITTINALNQAIESFNSAYPQQATTFRFKRGTLYPRKE